MTVQPEKLAFGKSPMPVLTVSELTRAIRELLTEAFPAVAVVGEISNVRRSTSGHIYLTLKDEGAQIPAVIWSNVARTLRFQLQDGLSVIVRGEVTVYERRGTYEIIVREIEPRGIGALELAFRQLFDRLQKEGLFDTARKRPIPAFPAVIGVVTSPTGAAIRDILHVIDKRFPRLRVLIYPVRVQGEGAALEIAAAIRDMNAHTDADVLVVGRGGGSLEDLWAFNEEVVARAIFASRIPIISAVGHEVDFTISDFVADERAATPTAAAERITREWAAATERLDRARARLAQALLAHVRKARDRVVQLAKAHALRFPLEGVRRREQRVDELGLRLAQAQRGILRLSEERLANLAGRLGNLNPLRVLQRGYSITTRAGDNRPLRDASELRVGDRVHTRLGAGAFTSVVEGGSHGRKT